MVEIFCDGSCFHVSDDNWMGMGVWIPTNKTMLAISGPKGTHNEAEYLAVICALWYALIYDYRSITIHSDSQLVIKQINGEYQTNKSRMRFLLSEVYILVYKLKHIGSYIEFKWVPRTHIEQKVADKLSKIGNKHFNIESDEPTIRKTSIKNLLTRSTYKRLSHRFNW